eukprot:scaffold7011_cov112-Isochrysis_galbana.AAC.23
MRRRRFATAATSSDRSAARPGAREKCSSLRRERRRRESVSTKPEWLSWAVTAACPARLSSSL